MAEPANVTLVDPGTALERKTAEFLKWRRQRREDRDRFYTEYERLVEAHSAADIDWGLHWDPVEKPNTKMGARQTGEDSRHPPDGLGMKFRELVISEETYSHLEAIEARRKLAFALSFANAR